MQSIRNGIYLRKYANIFNSLPQAIILKEKFLKLKPCSVIADDTVKIKDTGEVIFAFQDIGVVFSMKAKFYLLEWLLQDLPPKSRHHYQITTITRCVGSGAKTLRGFTQGVNGNYIADYDYDVAEKLVGYELSLKKNKDIEHKKESFKVKSIFLEIEIHFV